MMTSAPVAGSDASVQVTVCETADDTSESRTRTYCVCRLFRLAETLMAVYVPLWSSVASGPVSSVPVQEKKTTMRSLTAGVKVGSGASSLTP